MDYTRLEQRSDKFSVSNSADSTATSITFPAPQTTEPSGDGVIRMGAGGTIAPSGLQLVPFGVGTSGQTFLMNAYGWRETFTPTGRLWVAFPLGNFTCTLCTVPGLSGTDVDATHLFVGTITGTVAPNEVISPTGNVVAYIELDPKGAKFVELRFSTNSSATAMNCLYARCDVSRVALATNALGTTNSIGAVDTELPAAAALADNSTNPTTPMVGACALVYRSGGPGWYRLLAAEGVTDGNTGTQFATSANHNYNNSNYDRQRNNYEVTILASASRTTAQSGSDQTNFNHRGIIVVVDITVYTAGSLTITISAKDSLSGKYKALLTSSALAAAATTQLIVYPGATVAANLAVSVPLPRVWKIDVAVGDATAITYSIGANYIL